MANTIASDIGKDAIIISTPNLRTNSFFNIIGEDYFQGREVINVNTEPFAWQVRNFTLHRLYSNHLDKKYPHECFKCKTDLTFKELFEANRNLYLELSPRYHTTVNFDMPLYRRLKKLWKSQVVEFYCCECFISP